MYACASPVGAGDGGGTGGAGCAGGAVNGLLAGLKNIGVSTAGH